MRYPKPLPPELIGRPFTVAEASALGVPRARLRASDIRRLARGVYTHVPPSAELEVNPHATVTFDALTLDAIETRCPGAVWIGAVATQAWGLPHPLTPDDPRPQVLLPPDSHRRTCQSHRVVLGSVHDTDIAVIGGRRVLRPAPLLPYLARTWAPEDVIAVGDLALRRALMTVEAALAAATANGRRRCSARTAHLIADLDPRSASPMESRLRYKLMESGIPRPRCNYTVLWAPPGYRGGEAEWLGELDLAWPDARVGVEYDGEPHAKPRARSLDYAKRALFAQHGWEVIPVTAWDYFNSMPAVASKVRDALRSASLRSA